MYQEENKMKSRSYLLTRAAVLSFVLLTAISCSATATVSDVGPFSGSLHESWESFPNNSDSNDRSVPDLTPIMSGNAIISNRNMVAYGPDSCGFGLGYYGDATVFDGKRALGINSQGPASITFQSPITEFGGYWGASKEYSWAVPSIQVIFYDTGGNLVESKSFNFYGGSLAWHGWSSSVAIGKVSINGHYVVMDALQANPVPEPPAFLVLSVGSLTIMLKRLLQFK